MNISFKKEVTENKIEIKERENRKKHRENQDNQQVILCKKPVKGLIVFPDQSGGKKKKIKTN